MPAKPPAQAPPRIAIQRPTPQVDAGLHPVKRTAGDAVTVGADIFRDGHDVLRAVVQVWAPGRRKPTEHDMHRVDAERDGDRWEGTFGVETLGTWQWTVTAWTDAFASWRHELERKHAAAQPDLGSELLEGAALLEEACGRAKGPDGKLIGAALRVVGDPQVEQPTRVQAALDPMLAQTVSRNPDRSDASTLEPHRTITVDRARARFGSWYELFPRSWGGLRGTADQLPALADLGFDVLYLPPIHPIGATNRKGPNNTLTAGPNDPGSPWAIGDATGGHTALHPELGTWDDFDALITAAQELGIDVALDLAIQCSADHPWLGEHPEWFHHRPDGTLKYAENPPKKYQDIYNVNWDCADWKGLWSALLDVTRFWVDKGVRVFRVDNPHTKPLPFWEWLIAAIRKDHPEVVFLAEAFTRAAMMRELARIGFSQSYTYFTWKSSKHDLTEYVTELATSGMQEYYRPNFFVNTPDILTEELVHGGPPKFASRLVLAATLSPAYGVYSGYEHFENQPVTPGSEEYLDSEKYEARRRRLDGPLLPLIDRVNTIRREHPALQHLDNIRFLETENDALIAYVKRTGTDTVICVVTLDPHHAQEGVVVIPYDTGLPPAFEVEDCLSSGTDRFHWRLGRNYVRLDPYRVAHVLAVTP